MLADRTDDGTRAAPYVIENVGSEDKHRTANVVKGKKHRKARTGQVKSTRYKLRYNFLMVPIDSIEARTSRWHIGRIS